MAEMAVAIMVVSLPSMRAYIRRGGILASKGLYGSSSSNRHRHRISITRNERFALSSKEGSKGSAPVHPEEDDSGSEVELNTIRRKDVIYETRRISVQFSDSTESRSQDPKKVS